MCVSRLETFDRWRNSSHVQTFRYRNAYFDRHNRDFRGFAFSEQTAWDDIVLDPSISDERSVRLATPKNVTRTWYHTGEAIDPKEYLNIYCHDTFTPAGISIGGHAITLEEFMAAPSINPDTWHWGVRALSGQLLRVEKYFGDGSNMATTPVDITCHSVLSKQLQHEGANADLAPAVFWPLAIGTLVVTLNGINDGDARISQTLVLSTDSFFNVTARLSVEYGRFQSTADISPKAREAAAVQLAPIVVLTYNEYTLGLIDNESLLVPHIWQTRSFQLTGAVGIGGDASLMDPSRDLGELLVELDAYPQVDFETDMYSPEADWKTKSKRMFSHKTYSYYHDDLTTSSSTTQPEQVGPLVLLAYTQTKAISEGLLQSVLGEKMDESSGIFSTSKEMQKAGYYKDADDDWVFKTTSNGYVSDDERGREKHSARARFFTPVFFRDPLNNETVIEHDKYALFAVRVTNALQEQTTKLYDYRVLKVKHTIDANRNRETNIYDALGRLVGQPLVSKVAPGAESKSPEAKEEILLGGNYEGDGHANDNFLESIVDAAPAVLGVLASRIVRQANTSSDSSTPPWEAHITRQLPMVKNSESTAGMIQITVLYMDGFMSILQTKHFRGNGQWWTSAWATKAPGAGSAVKIFQPFLSTTVAAELRPHGFAATFCKDGTGKDLGQVNRDRSWTKTIHHPWYAAEYSRGDLANVSVPTEDIDIGHQLLSLCSQDELPWTLQERQDQSSDEVNVQNKAYANTPTMIHFSPNGSTVAIQESLGETIPSLTTVQLSEGTSQLIRRQRDPRGVGSESLVLDMIGHAIHQRLADSGDRWSIYDALGRVTWTWDSRHSVFCQEYDKVGRKTRLWWSKTDKATPNMIPIESIKYGDGIDRAADLNLVGRVHEIRDQSGIFRITSRDQHYNGLSTEQTLRESPSSWNSVEDETTADLSKEKVTFSFTFDLQNRLMSQKGYSGTLVEYAYNLSGLLTSVHATCVGQETPFPIISGTEYDEFWQKTAVKYGNGTWTRHVFDERTGQLMQRATISSRDQSMIEGDLFDYDADGNIVSITELLPSSGGDTKVGAIRQRAYYDALHRLIGSTGRQELNVGKASENFVDFKERFSYDDSGNMTGSETGYSGDDMSSVVETLSYSESDNRLVSIKRTGNTGDNDNTSTLSYDAHGNITGGLTSGQAFEWDGKDQLVSTTMENTVSSYVYDYDGERTHKVTIESERKKTIEECKYYAFGLERRVMDVEGQPVQHDIQTIRLPPNTAAHDDVLATVEASSSGDVPASLNVKLLDHLGSVLTEIDRDGRSQMQSREYSAFGKVVAGSDGAPLDNRGFQGKERDGASGLQYHSRRYYSVELRRWISPDPLGVADGLNGYLFVGNNPVNYRDPQGLMMKSSADRNRDDEEEDKRNSGRKRFFDESSHGKEQSGRKMRTGKKGNKDKQREEQGQRLAAMYDAYYGPIWPPRLEEEFGKYRRPETEPQRNQVPARLLVPSHGPLRFAQQAQPLRVQQAPPQRGGPQAPLGGGPPVGGVPAAAPGRGPPVAPGRGPPAAPGRGPPVAPGRGPPAAAPGGGLPVAPVPGRGPPGPGPGAGPLAPGPGGGPLVAAPWRGPGAGRGRGRGIHIVIPPGFVPGGAPGPALRALMGARGGPQQGNNYGR
jgi:RHS repeat-associated protein